MRYYLKFSTWFACRYARKIIAVSGQTRRDLMQKYSLPESKITVVYHGFSHEEPVQSSPEELKKIEDLPAKFVLYLGTLQPRKNPQGLIDAFIELKKERGLEHSLVLVGGKGWLYSEIMDKISRHPEVIYLGYIKNRFAVLRKADLLVQPAFYEGFGLQILDAFSVEVPVAASNVSSLPEIAGDAAAYFDPKNKNDIKQAIYNVLTDKGLRERLVQNGNYRLKEFSWRKCAEQTLSVIKN